MRVESANAIGATRQSGDVLLVTLTGAVTDETYGVALRCVSAEVGEGPIRALVIDMARAGPVTGGHGLLASERFCLAHLDMPCGLVVPAEMLTGIRRECFRVSALGITWVAFLRLQDALDWASTRAWSLAACPRRPHECGFEHPTPPLLH